MGGAFGIGKSICIKDAFEGFVIGGGDDGRLGNFLAKCGV